MCDLETPAIRQARRNLGRFLQASIEKRRRDLGFGWQLTNEAPRTYAELRHAFQASQLHRHPLPVRPLATGDGGFLFWHDTTHAMLNHDFTPEGETAVARHQLLQLQMAGYPPTSMEHRVLTADSLSHIHCGIQIGRYPRDSATFSTRAVLQGTDQAIALEAQRP
ncbi:MAG: hypothetical protein AAGA37_13820 [Actinomycetota bacterium]